MGYDMYVCDNDGHELVESGWQGIDALHPGIDLTDEAAVDAAWDAIFDGPFYLRRSMGNQGSLRAALLDTRMGYEAVGKPTFPDWPGDEHFDSRDYSPVTEQGQQYRVAVQHTLRSTFDERPGIPLHKLCSNDGWWVTAAEVRSALAMWELAGQPYHPGLRDDVLPFLNKAAENGGFRVH